MTFRLLIVAALASVVLALGCKSPYGEESPAVAKTRAIQADSLELADVVARAEAVLTDPDAPVDAKQQAADDLAYARLMLKAQAVLAGSLELDLLGQKPDEKADSADARNPK